MVRRCRRTDARNATVGPDDQATSSSAPEANRPLKAVLDAQTAWLMGAAANIQAEGVLTLAAGSGDSGRTLAAG